MILQTMRRASEARPDLLALLGALNVGDLIGAIEFPAVRSPEPPRRGRRGEEANSDEMVKEADKARAGFLSAFGNLSPAVVARLTAEWQAEYDAWQKRDLSARRYLYVWADGVYLQARMEETPECMLVLTGATPEGKKELINIVEARRARILSL